MLIIFCIFAIGFKMNGEEVLRSDENLKKPKNILAFRHLSKLTLFLSHFT